MTDEDVARLRELIKEAAEEPSNDDFLVGALAKAVDYLWDEVTKAKDKK